MGRLRLAMVLIAGLLTGALGMGGILALSGLQISRTPWSPEMESPPQAGVSHVALPEKAPTIQGEPPEMPRRLSRVHLGPIPSDVATDVVGELTLAGFGARVRVVSVDGKSLQVVSSGPYPQTTIDAIVALVRRKFPKVHIIVVPVK